MLKGETAMRRILSLSRSWKLLFGLALAAGVFGVVSVMRCDPRFRWCDQRLLPEERWQPARDRHERGRKLSAVGGRRQLEPDRPAGTSRANGTCRAARPHGTTRTDRACRSDGCHGRDRRHRPCRSRGTVGERPQRWRPHPGQHGHVLEPAGYRLLPRHVPHERLELRPEHRFGPVPRWRTDWHRRRHKRSGRCLSPVLHRGGRSSSGELRADRRDGTRMGTLVDGPFSISMICA